MSPRRKYYLHLQHKHYKKTPNHTQDRFRHGWRTSRSGLYLQHLKKKDVFHPEGQGSSWSSPRLMRHCRAHSSQQHSAPYWDVNFQVLTTFMSRNHEFIQQWQLTPPTRNNTSCRGKTHGWERPHEEQVISSAQGEGGAPLPVGIRQFPLPWLPPINSFWDSGDHQFLTKVFFSQLYYTKRDKIPAEDRPRRQKLLLFLNRLIPQNIMSETSCLPASRKKIKGRSSSSIGSSRKLPHTHTLKFWQRRNLHPLQAQQERQENTLISISRFLVSPVSCGNSILLEGIRIRSRWTSPPPAVRSQIPFFVVNAKGKKPPRYKGV